jgi:2-oxoglutarate dehydrogenase E2 component (dihydrolipoamide succinyltransferase)
MAIVDLVMPKLGESIMEATILKWHKQPGDAVKMDDTVLEIATDKVDSEVPSTSAGVIEDVLFKVNDVVPIGTVIARIRTSAAETVAANPVSTAPVKDAVFTQPAEKAIVMETIHRPTTNISAGTA